MRVFSRRSGMSFSGLLLTVAAIYGGYRAWQDYRRPYRLTEEKGTYFLVDKNTDRKKIITKNFQLGTLDYRIDGILQESRERVRQTLDSLARKYDLDHRQNP
jgi:hypothetical protein